MLARHGESATSAGGRVNGDPLVPVGLTPAGREQARRLGELLADTPLDLAVTSAFPRTVETADIATAGRGVPRLVVPELNDLVFGGFEAQSLREYRAWVAAHGPDEAPPGGGESRAAAVARWVRGFRTVLRRPERSLLVVCHGMPIRYVLAALEGVAPSAVARDIGYAEPYTVGARDLVTALDALAAWAARPHWPAPA